MNSAFIQNLAEAAAKTAAAATGEAEQIGLLYRRILARDPTVAEMKSAMDYLRKGTLQRYAQVLLATNEEIFVHELNADAAPDYRAQLGGGLGVVGFAGLFASLSRNTVHAAGLGNYPVPLVAPKAKHVIMLYMNGGPSQLDMFDPKPALFKYAGQRPTRVDLRTERRRWPAAVAVRVQALRTQRRRGERAAAAARECHRRRVRHSIDVHVQPHTHARPRLVPHRQRAGDASVDGIVDHVRARV